MIAILAQPLGTDYGIVDLAAILLELYSHSGSQISNNSVVVMHNFCCSFIVFSWQSLNLRDDSKTVVVSEIHVLFKNRQGK